MIKQFTGDALSYGYPKQNIHYELFIPPEQWPGNEFKVRLEKSGIELSVPKDKSLLNVLLEHNINAPYSCKVGGCGSCQVNVLKGEISHRDQFLSDEKKKKQNNIILTCVSRAKGDSLVLDL
ncbi:2Fe-2S iron-sulfur cluster-binding protein [Terrilactibacillus sp. S3-3]|nr:2Fe-2S iron-sulfur cluster-binding protein [Terrilactibacillus sp. S3-3]